ncbi:PREDICTED: mevalonate kinase-like isoform X2 [Priapulus caudatus]|uniref:Mevalonate kinase n=1 Tax=Priapulus caudatus TaxID=37621 RepID=A0ABM1EAL8_PRICU|nr:PREDICTED: mevalonate kinase-like isoform X2 [Priapulus caudatus]
MSAPGKIILHGEHAVVYGKPALATSLNLRTTIHLSGNDGSIFILCLPSIDINKAWEVTDLELLYSTIQEGNGSIPSSPDTATLSRLRQFTDAEDGNAKDLAIIVFLYLHSQIIGSRGSLAALRVVVGSDLPVGAGLGSSAAYSVSLAAVLLVLAGQIRQIPNSWTREELGLVNSWAFEAERIIHGNPSGVDNAVSTYGGLILYRKGEALKPARGNSLQVVIVNSHVPRSTKRLVEKVKERLDKYPEIIRPMLESMEALVVKALDTMQGFENSDANVCYDILEELIDINQSQLNVLGVGHLSLEHICLLCQQNDFHCKLTGAGGGGCAFVLIRPDASKEKVKTLIKSIEEAGYMSWLTSIGGSGVTLHESMPLSS